MLDHRFLAQGPEKFGLLMSINALTVIISTMWITNITKRYKPLTNLVLAGVLYAIGFGMIGEIKSFFFFVISTILWTWGEILMATKVHTLLIIVTYGIKQNSKILTEQKNRCIKRRELHGNI